MLSEIENKVSDLSLKNVISLSVVGSVAFSTVLFLPRFIGGMVEDWGFSEQSAGAIASANIAGIAVAGFIAFSWVSKQKIARILVLSCLLLAVANVLTAITHTYGVLLSVRFIEGVAAGSITAGVAATFAQSSSPDRNIGVFIASQLLFGAVGNLLFPAIIGTWGIEGGYLAIAVVATLSVLLVVRFPWRRNAVSGEFRAEAGIYRFTWPVIAAIGAVAAFFFALNTVWAYLERIGVAAGHSSQFIGLTLSIGQMFGVVGAVSIAIVLKKISRLRVLSIGLLLMACFFLGLTQSIYSVMFVICVSVIVFFWSFLLPAMLGALAIADPTGRVVALTNGIAAVGLTVGPLLGGWLSQTGSYHLNLYAGAFLLTLSIFLIMPLVRRQTN